VKDDPARKVLGRPTKCTPDVIAKFREWTELGMPMVYICQYTGIDDSTYCHWIDLAKTTGKSPYKEFYEAIKEGEPAFIQNQLNVINAASKKEWTAAAWLAERRAASHFSKNATRIKLKQSQADASTEQKLLDMTNQILEQVSKGEMTLEEGKLAAAMIEEQRKVVETINATERVAAIEAKLKNLVSE
jgi:hypothetical protein